MRIVQWVILLALFTLTVLLFAGTPQSYPIEEISNQNIIIENSLDVLQTFAENTGSDLWSEATYNTQILSVCIQGADVLKLPRLSYVLFDPDNTLFFFRNADNNRFIA